MNINFLFLQLLLFLLATSANMISAFAGGGAGLVQLPMLLLLGLPFPVALATHKIASVALGLGASLRHFKEDLLDKKLSIFILLTGLPGVLLGARIILFIPEEITSILLGFLTLFLGIYSFGNSRFGIYQRSFEFNTKSIFLGGLVLFFIGILNGSLSSGTGLFVTVWLVSWFGLTYTQAIAHTLILVGLFWNSSGAIVLGFTSPIKWSWLPMLFLGSCVGGYLGAHLSLLKGNRIVKKFFEIISISIGTSLVIKAFMELKI
tara:strand:- start:2784 stop:3569 length:786 start_codon:yes stop_codon:yes gene_type:complete